MNNVVTYEKPAFPAVSDFQSRVALVTVVDQDTYDIATSEIRYFSEIRDTWEAERVRRKKPVDEIAKTIQGDFMPIINGADAAIATLKGMQKTFLIAEETNRRQEQAEADRVNREHQAALIKQAEAAEAAGKTEKAEAIREIAAVTTAVTVAPTAVKSAGTSLPKRWKGRVTNMEAFLRGIAAQPERHYLIEVLQSKIDRVINDTKGALKLPGVENYEDFDIRVRA